MAVYILTLLPPFDEFNLGAFANGSFPYSGIENLYFFPRGSPVSAIIDAAFSLPCFCAAAPRASWLPHDPRIFACLSFAFPPSGLIFPLWSFFSAGAVRGPSIFFAAGDVALVRFLVLVVPIYIFSPWLLVYSGPCRLLAFHQGPALTPALIKFIDAVPY